MARMRQILKLFFLLFGLHVLCAAQENSQKKIYIVTAADKVFYREILQLVGSIHKVNFNQLGGIAVFDLGLSDEQKRHLRKIQKLTVCSVEKTHPDIIKPFKKDNGTHWVPGWYAWKPVVIKQALDKWPYILYIDAGAIVLKPLDYLF